MKIDPGPVYLALLSERILHRYAALSWWWIMVLIVHCNDDTDYRGSRDESTDCTCVNYHLRSPSKFRLIIRWGDSGLLQSIKGGSLFSWHTGYWRDVSLVFPGGGKL